MGYQQQNPVRGFLVSVGLDPEILVQFQYNPTSLSDRRTVTYASITAPGMLMPARQYNQGGDRTITFSVQLDGLYRGPADDQIDIALDDDGSIAPELNKYRAFLYPATERWQEAEASFAPLYSEEREFKVPPACRFGWGNRLIDVVVTDINVTETLFNAQLAPLRATVAVTLVELVPYGNEIVGPA